MDNGLFVICCVKPGKRHIPDYQRYLHMCDTMGGMHSSGSKGMDPPWFMDMFQVSKLASLPLIRDPPCIAGLHSVRAVRQALYSIRHTLVVASRR